MGEIDHIVTCSPCFVEYHAIRRAWKWTRIGFAGMGLAASLLLAATFLLFFFGDHDATAPHPPPAKATQIANEVPRKRLIDLRPYQRFRGERGTESGRGPGPVILERVNLVLTIQLPVGSEEGKYLFKLIDANGEQRLDTSGDAVIRDYITTADAPFDLRKLSPGSFTLTVGRADEIEPVPYPVEIR
jgi:hypothetical protein